MFEGQGFKGLAVLLIVISQRATSMSRDAVSPEPSFVRDFPSGGGGESGVVMIMGRPMTSDSRVDRGEVVSIGESPCAVYAEGLSGDERDYFIADISAV